MSDIWDEKPKPVDTSGELPFEVHMYSLAEMDAWLEKLKIELDKLEAIRNFIRQYAEDYPMYERHYEEEIIFPLIHLWDLLKDETPPNI